jgi:hypothetical protein
MANELSGVLSLGSNTTIVAAVKENGTMRMFSPVVHLGGGDDHGLTISPINCAGGNPSGPAPCNVSSVRASLKPPLAPNIRWHGPRC